MKLDLQGSVDEGQVFKAGHLTTETAHHLPLGELESPA
jgi:hypothetical protein